MACIQFSESVDLGRIVTRSLHHIDITKIQVDCIGDNKAVGPGITSLRKSCR